MPTQVYFFTTIAGSLIMWSVIARSLWPMLRERSTAEALRPILTLHSFRFLGLAFLVPGVVSPDMPPAFAHAAAYGDLLAGVLAFTALLLLPRKSGILVAWIFNIVGIVDLVDAFIQAGLTGLAPGQLQVAYFLPTFMVPLFLVTHIMVFRILLTRVPASVLRERQVA